jgi:hypothetical protein
VYRPQNEEVRQMGKVEFKKLNASESWQVFDRAANRLLGVSGDEFARRWDEGRYQGRDSVEIMKVAMLRPSGR